jgi:hypothetical protein
MRPVRARASRLPDPDINLKSLPFRLLPNARDTPAGSATRGQVVRPCGFPVTAIAAAVVYVGFRCGDAPNGELLAGIAAGAGRKAVP